MLPAYIGEGIRAWNPQVIKLYINNVCNARCLICDVGQKNRQSVFFQQVTQNGSNTLSVKDCRWIINEVKDFKPRIHIHGLEPLLHKDILELIATIKKAGLYLHMVTNGILLPHRARDLVELGVNRVTVSLDGPEEIHDYIRGPGIYQKAVAGIRLLHKFRDQAEERVTKISVNFTINDKNFHAIEDFAGTMLHQERVDFITFIHMYYVTEKTSAEQHRLFPDLGVSSPINTNALDPAAVDVDVLWPQLQALRRQFRYRQIRFNTEFKSKQRLQEFYQNPQKPLSKKMCKTPWLSTTILANGDVVINNRCFYYKTGNIHQQSIHDIWNGPRYQEFRRQLKKAGSFPTCVRCHGTYPKM